MSQLIFISGLFKNSQFDKYYILIYNYFVYVMLSFNIRGRMIKRLLLNLISESFEATNICMLYYWDLGNVEKLL